MAITPFFKEPKHYLDRWETDSFGRKIAIYKLGTKPVPEEKKEESK